MIVKIKDFKLYNNKVFQLTDTSSGFTALSPTKKKKKKKAFRLGSYN